MTTNSEWRLDRDRWLQALLCDKRLNSTDKTIGALLGSMMSPERPEAWPAYDWIARRLGIASRTVERAIPALIRRGYLVKLRSGGFDMGRNVGWPAVYALNHTRTREFSLGLETAENPSPPNMATSSEALRPPNMATSSNGGNPGVSATSKAQSPPNMATSSEALRPPNMATESRKGGGPLGVGPLRPDGLRDLPASQIGDSNFTDFIALARSYSSKVGTMAGSASEEEIYKAWLLAVEVESPQDILAAYAEHLKGWAGHSGYTGDYALRWLQKRLANPTRNYNGSAGPASKENSPLALLPVNEALWESAEDAERQAAEYRTCAYTVDGLHLMVTRAIRAKMLTPRQAKHVLQEIGVDRMSGLDTADLRRAARDGIFAAMESNFPDRPWLAIFKSLASTPKVRA